MTVQRRVAVAVGLLLLAAAALQTIVSLERASVDLQAELRAEQRQLATILGSAAKSPDAAIRLAANLPRTTVRRVSLSQRAPENEQPELEHARLAPLLAGEPVLQVATATEGGERLLTYARIDGPPESAIELSRIVPAGAKPTSVLAAGAILLAACGLVAGVSGSRRREESKAPADTLSADALDRLEHLNHLAVVGTLSSGIIHDIGTPLNVISGRAMMIASGEASAAEIAENAGTIRQQCQKIAGMVRSLLTFARRTPAGMPPSLADILREDITLLEPVARAKKIKFELTVAAVDAGTHVERAELRQVLINILMNGLQAMPQGGRIGIEVGVAQSPAGRAGDWSYVGIEDAGGGIDSDTTERIFEPFFTTQPQREGAGLGLAIARRVIARHGGFIDVKSARKRGTRFTVYLPHRSQK